MGWACEGWNEALKTTEFPPRTMARILPLLTLGKGASWLELKSFYLTAMANSCFKQRQVRCCQCWAYRHCGWHLSACCSCDGGDIGT